MKTFILNAQTPVLWRSKDEVQFGLNPHQSIRVPVEVAQQILQSAQEHETGPFQFNEITPSHTTALNRENLAHDDVQRRLDTEIIIQGAGRMGTTIAVLLAGAGYPTIRVHDKSHITQADVTAWGPSRTDVGSRRDYIAYLLIERIYRGTWPRILRKPTTASRTLTVICPDPVADWPWFSPSLTDKAMANDMDHVVISSGSHNVHISSVIEPGKTSCMRCRDASLVDVDSAWPLITSQLIGRPPVDTTPSGLVLYAAHYATQLIHHWATGLRRESTGLWDISWPDLHTTFTALTPHPACGCQWNLHE